MENKSDKDLVNKRRVYKSQQARKNALRVRCLFIFSKSVNMFLKQELNELGKIVDLEVKSKKFSQSAGDSKNHKTNEIEDYEVEEFFQVSSFIYFLVF